MQQLVDKLSQKVLGKGIWFQNKLKFRLQRDNGDLIVFNTALGTENLGDYIIMHYCNLVLQELFTERNYFDISTHEVPSRNVEKKVEKAKYKIICGTNLLTSHIEKWWNWRLPDGFRAKKPYRNIILLGAGWGNYQEECSDYTSMIYKSLLNPTVLHSVRDQYTEDKLKAAGIKNVINTGCPTMWRLTPTFCKTISTEKADNVVTTITDYRRNIDRDSYMLNILGRNYNNVYLWLQGLKDEEYLRTLNKPDNLIVIPRDLRMFEEILNTGNIDYVGTRLHAGIFALNHSVRSFIIAVDNRAIEIAKDTALPIILSDRVEEELEMKIISSFATDIKIKEDNIRAYKAQFK